jgi:hypothetical protein
MHLTQRNPIKTGTLALLAVSAMLFAACEDAAGPETVDVRTDLQELAGKVSTFNPPTSRKQAAEGSLAKRGSGAKPCWNGSVDGVTISEAPATAEEPFAYWDTTWHYTAAGKPACEETDAIAYETFASRNKDAKSEAWIKGRNDYGPLAAPHFFRMKATGKVRYNSGYELRITDFTLAMSEGFGAGEFRMALSLKDGRYTSELGLPPGVGIGDDVPGNKVALSGPIKKGAEIVGYLEIMGDDRILVRDASRNLVTAR